MDVRFLPEGIHLPALDLWLDPKVETPRAFLSHGHADHAKGPHGEVLCSAVTAAVHRVRGGAASRHRPMPFHVPFEFAGATLTLLPAGHILGSAQLLVEHAGERLLYTGDIKLAPALCAEPATLVPCDHLIIESTFGLPIFRFLSADEARSRIVTAAERALGAGKTPVFLGYALGRGQELVGALSDAGIPVAAHGAVAKWLPLFAEETGRGFEAKAYERGKTDGCAVVGPSAFGRQLAATLAKPHVVAVSGWALLDSARARFGADELIAYSDHASFDELLEIVRRCAPRRVDVVHGHAAPFAAILRREGYDAHAPEAAAQPLDEEEVAA